MLSFLDIIIFGLGAVFLAIWIFLMLKGSKSSALFDPLDEKEYRLKDTYVVGYAVMEMLNYQYKSKGDRRLRKELEILYDEKYADYYMRVIYAQKVTMAYTVFVLAFPLYGLTESIAGLLLGFLFAGLAYYYFGTLTQKTILARSEEMLSDFSDVVAKLALLTNAGMILREAWEKIAYTGESALYLEMQRSVDDMNNGKSEVDAFYDFGVRCIIPEIKKFTSTIIQGLVKGNSELAAMLQQQSKEVWAAKKQFARRKGEKAASGLMLPIVIMFIGILVMVIVPIFANLGV